MKQYVVTIAPVDPRGPAAESRSQMTVTVEVSGGEAHVVELTVRALASTDLAEDGVPPVDLQYLARAFAPPEAEAEERPVLRAAAAASRTAASRSSSPRKPARKAERHRDEAETGVPVARAYRRMPEAAVLQAVYAEVGSIAGVAKHFDVPVHTAQGWIGRLRRQGEPASS